MCAKRRDSDDNITHTTAACCYRRQISGVPLWWTASFLFVRGPLAHTLSRLPPTRTRHAAGALPLVAACRGILLCPAPISSPPFACCAPSRASWPFFLLHHARSLRTKLLRRSTTRAISLFLTRACRAPALKPLWFYLLYYLSAMRLHLIAALPAADLTCLREDVYRRRRFCSRLRICCLTFYPNITPSSSPAICSPAFARMRQPSRFTTPFYPSTTTTPFNVTWHVADAKTWFVRHHTWWCLAGLATPGVAT